MGVTFLETSALLASIFHEPRCQEASDEIESSERLMASRLIQIEADRAMLRLALRKGPDHVDVQEARHEYLQIMAHVALWDVGHDICELAGRLAPQVPLRAWTPSTWPRTTVFAKGSPL